ncbi:MAG: DJ-1/PfpI family protein [Candidatus Aenigmatarchaeota archaeon]
MPNVLVVIAPEKFNEEEFFNTKKLLEEEGVKITVANSTGEPSVSKYGKTVEVEKLLKDIDEKEYDGIIFVGGSGASAYFNDKIVHKLVKKFFETGKVVGAICIAPTILANSGILKGKKATAYMTQKQAIEKVGIYRGNEVEQDGKIITCKWPSAVPVFVKKFIEAL